MNHDLLHRRDDLAHDHQLRRELDEATPSVGWVGLLIAAVILVTLGVVLFGQPAGDNTTSTASRETIEMPARPTPPVNP
jgi:hypothetical protein